jgi:hypothetical protein
MSGAGGRAFVTTRMTLTVAALDLAAPGLDMPDLGMPDPTGGGRRPDSTSRLVVLTGPREAVLNGINLRLTKIQYDLLLVLIDNAGRVLTRRQLLERVCDKPVGGCLRTIDVHIKRLRAKIAGGGPTITTIRGVGYRLDGKDRVVVADVM